MHCIVTAGPTSEKLDEVRRLTNVSTGKLGSELANFLVACGHQVTLLLGEQATYQTQHQAATVARFATTAGLRERLRALTDRPMDALFHAAAVSDFTFGKVWNRNSDGQLKEVRARKISTREGTLLAELIPTPKIIGELRDWYPKALLVGWKYEVDGDRAGVIGLGEKQLAECRTDACVVNGHAYGPGFGLVTAPGKNTHLADAPTLYTALEALLRH